MSDHQVLVYGAYGHTGRFVVDELLRRGMRPLLAGRDPARLAQYGDGVPASEQRVFSLESASVLRRGVEGAAVVINCAGPFLDTALPLATGAIAEGAHYLDLSAEQACVQQLYRELDATAASAGLAVIPAMAFYGGLADLLVTTALNGSAHADDVSIAIWVDRWWPTKGTRATGRRNTAPRLVVRDGALAPLDGTNHAETWDFPHPLGARRVSEVPFSEVMTISRHLSVRNLRSYITVDALADVRDPHTPPPAPADESGRSSQRFVVDVQVRQGDRLNRIGASGRDIYATSAPLVVEGAQRLLNGQANRAGASAPGQAFDAASILRALDGDVLTISGSEEPG